MDQSNQDDKSKVELAKLTLTETSQSSNDLEESMDKVYDLDDDLVNRKSDNTPRRNTL